MYKAKFNSFADLYKIFNPSVSPATEEVASMDVQYQYQDKQYSASAKLSTGDMGTKVMIPAEPYYIYKMRQMFGLPRSPASQEQQYQSSWTLFGGEESYSSDENQNNLVKRGMMAFPEFRNHAYKYNLEVNYEQTPESVQQIVWQYYQQWLNYKKHDVSVLPRESEGQPGKVNLSFRFQPNMERIHVQVDGPTHETIFFCPARIPTYLHRALTYDSDLIFYDDKKEERKDLGM
jgi:hypothetical protein